MVEIEASVEVEVDVRTAYIQWTQLESFPNFMGDVQSVKQLDERPVHWIADVGSRTREWDAEIVEQILVPVRLPERLHAQIPHHQAICAGTAS